MLVAVLVLALAGTSAVLAQDAAAQPVCSVNQLFNGQICTCAPGYFSAANDESKSRCEDECEEVFFSWFTYGKCVKGIFDRVGEEQQPACNLRCGIRLRLWTSIAIFATFAAAAATLLFTLPMCIASCSSCINAKKASKHSKRVATEQQQSTGTLPKEQQLQQYQSPYGYSYWPYGYAR
uniref:Transmembrane protein n=1 Tax=Panagrellus redivivus TaxID=6233 RepID=A0A7E4VZ42_PANRE